MVIYSVSGKPHWCFRFSSLGLITFFNLIELFSVLGKEARKKELKKNKRQRQMVRAAVLKGKDPMQILAEMEKIDQMG